MMDFERLEVPILFHPSSIGKVTTQPRNKCDREAGNLSQTAKDLCLEMAIHLHFGRKADIETKPMRKGKLQEEESLLLLSERRKMELVKNEERIITDYFTMEVDSIIYRQGKAFWVDDVKSCWTAKTFYKHLHLLAKDHKEQVMCYLDGLDATNGAIVYTLVNNDPFEIMDILRLKANKYPEMEAPYWATIKTVKEQIFDKRFLIDFLTGNLRDKFGRLIFSNIIIPKYDIAALEKGAYIDRDGGTRSQEAWNSFVEIPKKQRLIEFKFDRDQELIDFIKSEIDKCRKYMADEFNIHHIPANQKLLESSHGKTYILNR